MVPPSRLKEPRSLILPPTSVVLHLSVLSPAIFFRCLVWNMFGFFWGEVGGLCVKVQLCFGPAVAILESRRGLAVVHMRSCRNLGLWMLYPMFVAGRDWSGFGRFMLVKVQLCSGLAVSILEPLRSCRGLLFAVLPYVLA